MCQCATARASARWGVYLRTWHERSPQVLAARRHRRKCAPPAATALQFSVRPPPVVAGQDPAAFFACLGRALVEHKPISYDELLLVKRLVEADWRTFLLQEMQSASVSATIGDQLMNEIAETGTDPNEPDERRLQSRASR